MIIVISNLKGGVGKSTLCLNLAVMLKATQIIDLDFQGTLSQVDKIRIKTNKPSLNVTQISEEKALIDEIKKDSDKDLTIIDCGGYDSKLIRMAIFSADLLITPLSDKGFDVMSLNKYEKILEKISAIKKETVKTNILLNNINPQTKSMEGVQEFIKKSPHFTIIPAVIRTRVAISYASSKGLAVIEDDQESKSTLEFEKLVKHIKTKYV